MKLVVITSHPIPCQVPIWRALARCPDIKLKVLYASLDGARPFHNSAFGRKVDWGVEMLDGYDWMLVENRPLSWINWRLAIRCPDIGHVLDNERPDAVLLVGKELWYYQQALGAAVSRGIPVIYRSVTPPPCTNSFIGHLKTHLRKRMYSKMSGILCVGKSQYDFYANHGIPESRMYWSPYCVDNAFFQTERMKWSAQRSRIRREFGFEDPDKVIAFVAKFTRIKRPMDIIQAYEMLPDRGSFGLLMAGTGELLEKCREYVASQHLNKVCFTEFKNQYEIGAVYAAADCFVLPSQSETWGLVVNEAMIFGLPMIISNTVTCSSDLVQDNQNGFTYPMGDVPALSARIHQVFADEHLRRQMALNSEKLIADYSVEISVKGILDCLRDIALKCG